ncbi:MAG TPA: CTP synthase [Methylomirabilota bacterium]|nr:CTP synthase [Methylomirabilota bacterium]
MMTAQIGLVGDYDAGVTAHQAIPRALALAEASVGARLAFRWLPTESIDSDAVVAPFDALWCVPASPYRSMDGALRAIRFAREAGRPFLGTCGGFQHAVVEYARNVLGWADAEHAETAPDAARPVITPLACSLVEVKDKIRLLPGTRISAAYGTREAAEGYHCRYGLNEAFRESLTNGPLHVTAEDAAGDIRALELEGHPFFVATLFQPERAALADRLPPLVAAFARAATEQALTPGRASALPV